MSVNFTVSLRLNEEENKLIRSYAEIKGLTVSEFLRESAMNEIKLALDIAVFDEAYLKHIKKPTLLSSEELRKKLGL